MNFSAFMFVITPKTHPDLVSVSGDWHETVKLKPQIVRWLKENLSGRYSYQPGEMQASVVILQKDDAALFKMMWL